MRNDRFLLPTVFVVAALLVGGAARAQVHFTTPAPSFEEARQLARQEGKPLLVEISASWCGPCKTASRELRKPRAQPALGLVHLVVYNGEEEPGLGLMQKFGVSSYPGFIAVDENGEEATRKLGFGQWADFEEWLKSLPEQAVTLDAQRKAADGRPADGKLQLTVAGRLLKGERYAEAATYYGRAQKAGPKDVAAQAAWVLLQLKARELQQKALRPAAATLVSTYPGSKEAVRALRFLAVNPSLPSKEMEALLTRQLEATSEAAALGTLATIALKARAYKSAVAIAAKLEPLTRGKAAQLDTLAEVAFLAEGNADKAIALAERALEAAAAGDRAAYTANLERYRRNQRETGSELASFAVPSLELPSERSRSSSASTLGRIKRALTKEIREGCWQTAGPSADSVSFLVLAAPRPAEHRVLATVSATPELLACATKIIQATELPGGDIVSLYPELTPAAFEDRLDEVRGDAEDDCAARAEKTARRIRAVLRAEAGKPVAVHFALDAAGKPIAPELRECLEQGFRGLKAPRPLLRDVVFELRGE